MTQTNPQNEDLRSAEFVISCCCQSSVVFSDFPRNRVGMHPLLLYLYLDLLALTQEGHITSVTESATVTRSDRIDGPDSN